MEIFKRYEVIQMLLFHLDVPRDEFIYDLKQGIGPYDPDFFEKCQSQSNKGPNTRGKKGPLRLVFCGALAGVLVI